MKFIQLSLAVVLISSTVVVARETDTLSSWQDSQSPGNFEAMWGGFDPRAEPLEVEILKEWKEEDVVLRVVRFRIGVFKGQAARLAAIYGFPQDATQIQKKLPGLVQIHGGGQYADHRACLMNAKRGYATLSLAWAGRISAPGYQVTPAEVKLFWDGKTGDPKYRLTTDWGAVDGYHAPGRNPGNQFLNVQSEPWTLDKLESPRNSGWFLCALAARRALTFLERQPEVDPNKLGVYGHSMGGKLTVMTASDSRVKAAAPSCGGISDRYSDSQLYRATLGDDVSLRKISCPIVFLSPSNDFHGRISDLPKAVNEIASSDWRVTCAPHHNHQDTPEYEAATMLWFDQHLKHSFEFPHTPETTLELNTIDGVPLFTVKPDRSKAIISVDVFYTQQDTIEQPDSLDRSAHRFWNHAPSTVTDGVWTARLPLSSPDRPLWVYANVLYPLSEPVMGAGYYYGTYSAKSFNLSSILKKASVKELRAANSRAPFTPSLLIEDFEGDWEKEWFTYTPENWARTTYKLHDQRWAAPANATLTLEVRSAKPNKLVVQVDQRAAEVEVIGGERWQQITLAPRDFSDAAGKPLPGWKYITQLTLTQSVLLTTASGATVQPRNVGAPWIGGAPRFRNLRWHVPEAASHATARSALLDVFPQSIAEVQLKLRGETDFSRTYQPSGSLWDPRLDESQVFQFAMEHRQSTDNSFKLRVGKGGQIYSLRGVFGESLPPSWRSKGRRISAWNDEVWQFVAVCSKYNGIDAATQAGTLPDVAIQQMKRSPYQSSFFIHNSGTYGESVEATGSLYCPLLASEVGETDRSIRMLNWGLVPQVRTVHRSPLLYYMQVRDVGDGIVELTWVVHNFSVRNDIVFDHLNAPWGGTRITSLPFRYVSSPNGGLLNREDLLDSTGVVQVEKTGGWNLSCAQETDDSPCLALVYGRDRHLQAERAREFAGEQYCQFDHTLYRDWRPKATEYERGAWKDWKTRPANSFRNYDVCEVIPKLRIAPQTTIWYRSFLVVGRKGKTVELARSLVDKVDYGLLDFDPKTTPSRTVSCRNGNISVDDSLPPSSASFRVFTRPVRGTRPLFLIRNTQTNQQIVTSDPYFFVKKERLDFSIPPEHPQHDYYNGIYGYSLDRNFSEWQALLGFAYDEKPATGSWKQLSELVDQSMFPAPNQYHRNLWVHVGKDY